MPSKSTKVKLSPFVNEAPTNFSNPKEAAAMKKAFEKVRAQFGRTHFGRIAGEKISANTDFQSINPCNKKEVLGTFPNHTESEAEKALMAATEAFQSWQKVPVEKRAQYLFKAAALMRKRKHEFSAALGLEIGKNWGEADMETAEAIDFLEFYARDAFKYQGPQAVVKSPKWLGKEENQMIYIPLGVGVSLPPWNFPLAILGGMTLAPIVMGNTMVLKPSPDAPFIASMFMALMEEVKLPKGVLNLVYGGAEVGEALVSSPLTRFISFTGSKNVGLRINEVAAKTQPGQRWMKRLVAELGGKDAIIVDREADLDAAAQGVVQSAFGFSGQKCSACSRVLVDEKVYDKFLEKLVPKVETIKIGDAEQNAVMTSVSSEKAFKKVSEYIEIGKQEARLLTGGQYRNENGFFIEPTVFADVPKDARIAREEIFGPVLSIVKVKDLNEGLEVANSSEYGLTGGVFTKNKKKLERVREEMMVGNLYLNRKITGALVGVHPFGGFNMSGTDSKTGGKDYLLLFVQAKTITERIN
ncbi:MAG: L-glutamate gamma-semialdehyde dehydrogenase [Chloroherpetonaceae bacterium]|nr:L-glutamate gamma-semialdehyde dehydrogenase [Chloroherpetonaceae bacterium]